MLGTGLRIWQCKRNSVISCDLCSRMRLSKVLVQFIYITLASMSRSGRRISSSNIQWYVFEGVSVAGGVSSERCCSTSG